MTATKDSVLLYTTHRALLPEVPSLVDQLNQPNRQFTQPYNLPDVIQPAPFPNEDQIGASLDILNEKHHSWIAQNDLDVNMAPNASLFIVADKDTLDNRTVQVVYLGSDVENDEKGYAAKPDFCCGTGVHHDRRRPTMDGTNSCIKRRRMVGLYRRHRRIVSLRTVSGKGIEEYFNGPCIVSPMHPQRTHTTICMRAEQHQGTLCSKG
uniref:Uncharacterized protein n=1 Tax=Moniliophthora roreri TaxID=221103 RepID=A0A0W0F3Q1_MONRR